MAADGTYPQRMSEKREQPDKPDKGGRVHRLLVAELQAGETEIRGPEAHHLANVLRVKPGAVVEAFDGAGSVASGTVVRVDRQSVAVSLEEPTPALTEAPLRVTVAVALLKSDKLSDVVRQCTELGAAGFELLVTRQADATTISPARLLRLRRVAEEAARQSGRATVPVVNDPVQLDALTWQEAALVAHPEAGLSLESVWPPRQPEHVPGVSSDVRGEGLKDETSTPTQVTLITGPEGGFGDEEVAQLLQRGAVGVSFGPRILRAETAPVALTAALLLPRGR